MKIDSMNISSYIDSRFPLFSSNAMRYVILVAMNDLSLSLFDNAFMYCNRSLVVDTVSPERVISC